MPMLNLLNFLPITIETSAHCTLRRLYSSSFLFLFFFLVTLSFVTCQEGYKCVTEGKHLPAAWFTRLFVLLCDDINTCRRPRRAALYIFCLRLSVVGLLNSHLPNSLACRQKFRRHIHSRVGHLIILVMLTKKAIWRLGNRPASEPPSQEATAHSSFYYTHTHTDIHSEDNVSVSVSRPLFYGTTQKTIPSLA